MKDPELAKMAHIFVIDDTKNVLDCLVIGDKVLTKNGLEGTVTKFIDDKHFIIVKEGVSTEESFNEIKKVTNRVLSN